MSTVDENKFDQKFFFGFLSRLKVKTKAWTPTLVSLLALSFVVFILQISPSSWFSGLHENYVSIHILIEMVGIVVSFATFAVGWITYANSRSTDLLIVSTASLSVAVLDLGHALSSPGMPALFVANGVNKQLLFWLVARLTAAISLLYVSLRKAHEYRNDRPKFFLLTSALIWSIGWFWIIVFHANLFPEMYVQSQGPTSTKILLESIIGCLWLAAGFFFMQRGRRQYIFSFQWIACACFIFALTSLIFTRYKDFEDLYVFIGHLYKIIGFFVLFRAVLVECVNRPYLEAKISAEVANKANQARTEFLANVSHELRTPLGIISGFGEQLLERAAYVEAEHKKWLQMIVRNSQQLHLLIDDLLDLAKTEQGKIELYTSRFNVLDIIDEVIEGLRLNAQKKQISIEISYKGPRSSFDVVSDSFRLRQIVLNLVSNAVKFTLQGKVVVSIELAGTNFKIHIQDSGIGISPANAKNLFTAFMQGDDSSRRRIGGTGLGLALSKKLCLLLGGDLYLERSDLNNGSTFSLELPIHLGEKTDSNIQVQKISASKFEPPDLTGFKILYAEDSLENQALLSVYLKKTGVVLSFANNGLEAVQKASQEFFDLILMDIQMPEMDGFEAVTTLRKNGWKGPIQGLSASAHPAERERAMSGGFNAYLTKPISRKKLLDSIEAFLKPKRKEN
jgi:signal transduction histidine kinase/CheY-like chemotaxis protein